MGSVVEIVGGASQKTRGRGGTAAASEAAQNRSVKSHSGKWW